MPICYLEYDWNNDPTYKGGTFGIFPPGRNLNYNIKPSFNNIHWAGSDTADVWRGFMEGACQSGLRASNIIAEKLKLAAPALVQPGATIAQPTTQTQTIQTEAKTVVKETSAHSKADTITVGNR